MVRITSSGEQCCAWCFQKKEGVEADFNDGLKGFFCWADFRKAVKVRSNPLPAKKQATDK